MSGVRNAGGIPSRGWGGVCPFRGRPLQENELCVYRHAIGRDADQLLPTPDAVWEGPLASIATDALVVAVANVIRHLLLPEYAEQRPGDRRPDRALEAAETVLRLRTDNARAHAAAFAKACSAARRETFGGVHRIAEAARAVATSVTRRTDAAIRHELFDALAKTEEHLFVRERGQGIYTTEAEIRARILESLFRQL